MNDRELLELAAKANGMQVLAEGAQWPRENVGWFFNQVGDHPPALYDRSSQALPRWSPLTDDGDALRLAVKLGLTIAPANGSRSDITEVYRNSSILGRSSEGRAESHGKDPYTATRRCIVRAAAEIGKAMP